MMDLKRAREIYLDLILKIPGCDKSDYLKTFSDLLIPVDECEQNEDLTNPASILELHQMINRHSIELIESYLDNPHHKIIEAFLKQNSITLSLSDLKILLVCLQSMDTHLRLFGSPLPIPLSKKKQIRDWNKLLELVEIADRNSVKYLEHFAENLTPDLKNFPFDEIVFKLNGGGQLKINSFWDMQFIAEAICQVFVKDKSMTHFRQEYSMQFKNRLLSQTAYIFHYFIANNSNLKLLDGHKTSDSICRVIYFIFSQLGLLNASKIENTDPEDYIRQLINRADFN